MTVELDAEIIRQTRDAVLCDFGEDENVWIPKSQLLDDNNEDLETGKLTTLTLPEWLAKDKGLI